MCKEPQIFEGAFTIGTAVDIVSRRDAGVMRIVVITFNQTDTFFVPTRAEAPAAGSGAPDLELVCIILFFNIAVIDLCIIVDCQRAFAAAALTVTDGLRGTALACLAIYRAVFDDDVAAVAAVAAADTRAAEGGGKHQRFHKIIGAFKHGRGHRRLDQIAGKIL